MRRPHLLSACRVNPPLWTWIAKRLIAERSFFALASPPDGNPDHRSWRRGSGFARAKSCCPRSQPRSRIRPPHRRLFQRTSTGRSPTGGWPLVPEPIGARSFAPSMMLLAIALEVIFTRYNLRLAVNRSQLHWQKGLYPSRTPSRYLPIIDPTPQRIAQVPEKLASAAPASEHFALQRETRSRPALDDIGRRSSVRWSIPAETSASLG